MSPAHTHKKVLPTTNWQDFWVLTCKKKRRRSRHEALVFDSHEAKRPNSTRKDSIIFHGRSPLHFSCTARCASFEKSTCERKCFFPGATCRTRFARCGAWSGAALDVHWTSIHSRAYSSPPNLSVNTKTSLDVKACFFPGATCRTRTYDNAVNSRGLYRLS